MQVDCGRARQPRACATSALSRRQCGNPAGAQLQSAQSLGSAHIVKLAGQGCSILGHRLQAQLVVRESVSLVVLRAPCSGLQGSTRWQGCRRARCRAAPQRLAGPAPPKGATPQWAPSSGSSTFSSALPPAALLARPAELLLLRPNPPCSPASRCCHWCPTAVGGRPPSSSCRGQQGQGTAMCLTAPVRCVCA